MIKKGRKKIDKGRKGREGRRLIKKGKEGKGEDGY